MACVFFFNNADNLVLKQLLLFSIMVPRYMGFDIPLIEQNGGDEMGNCLQEIPVCVRL